MSILGTVHTAEGGVVLSGDQRCRRGGTDPIIFQYSLIFLIKLSLRAKRLWPRLELRHFKFSESRGEPDGRARCPVHSRI